MPDTYVLFYLFEGKYKKDEQPEKDALIKLEKSPFDDRTIEKYLTKDTELRLTFQNDIYYQYTATAIPELNSLKAITIVPATDKHMLKYSKQDFYIVNETPRDYKEITLPYINGNQHSLQVSAATFYLFKPLWSFEKHVKGMALEPRLHLLSIFETIRS